jgi:hypothetical protein
VKIELLFISILTPYSLNSREKREEKEIEGKLRELLYRMELQTDSIFICLASFFGA